MKNLMMVLVLMMIFINLGCGKKEETRTVEVPGGLVLVELETSTNELLIQLAEDSNTLASVIFSEEAQPVLEISATNFNFGATIRPSFIAVTVEAVNSGELHDGDIIAVMKDGNTEIASAILKDGRLEFQFGLAPIILPTELRSLTVFAKRTNGLLVRKSFRFGIVSSADVDAGNSVVGGLPIWGPIMNTERGEVIFSRKGKITNLNLTTGKEKVLSPQADPFAQGQDDVEPTVQTGGVVIAFISSDAKCRRHSVFIMYTNGTGRRRLTGGEGKLCAPNTVDSSPSISSDGKLVAFTRTVYDKASGAFLSSDILTVGVLSGEVRYLTTDLVPDRSPVFSSSGAEVYFVSSRSGNLSLHRISIKGGMIYPMISSKAGAVYMDPAVNPVNGKVALSELKFATDDNGDSYSFQDIITMNPDGSDRRQITQAEKNIYYDKASWGPNGKMLVRRHDFSNDNGKYNILIMDSSGSNFREITGLGDVYGKVSFSR